MNVILASRVWLGKLSMSNLNSAGLVYSYCYSWACNYTFKPVIMCSTQCTPLEKYMLLFCKSPNKYLYSADYISLASVHYFKSKNISTLSRTVVSPFATEYV